MNNLSAMTREELEAMVLKYKSQANRKLSFKVSDKGAVSVYGMGRFPVTLYREQWEKLWDHREAINLFIEDNASLLSNGKDDPRFAKQTEQ